MNNRIESFGAMNFQASASARGASPAALLDRSEVDGGFALFAPLHYEAKYAYPLIVWLHDTGENEKVIKRVMPHVSLRNHVAVAPRGTAPVHVVEDDEVRRFEWRQDEEHVYLANLRVMSAIDQAAARLNVNRRRVFLAGSGTGGTMALRIALGNPQEFAGALAIDGALPRGGAPLLRLRDARQLPLFIGSGRTSQVYPAASVCDDLRLLYAAGMSVTLKEYPGSDLCRPQVLSDIDRWVMEILAGQKEASVVTSARH